MAEMFISFIVMFTVFTLLVFYYKNYTRPIGLDYENVWNVGYGTPPGMSDRDSIANFRENIKQLIKSMPKVQEVSFSDANIPYGDASIGTLIDFNKINWQTEMYTVDDNFQNLLKLNLIEGRWFSKQDEAARVRSIVINETLKKNVFGNEDALGKITGDAAFGTGDMRVIGVVQDTKDKGDYAGAINGYYRRIDTSNLNGGGKILIRVQPGADAAFESKLYKALSNALPNTSIDIKHMDKERTAKNVQLVGPLIVIAIIGGFLIINVALGLFGVLWYNINKRRGEIGLRRAVGASGSSISKQLIGESMVLATISLIVGTFFAVQFPLLNVFNLAAGTYLEALGLSILFIYTLVLICSIYPGKQAAAIYPAAALHED